MQLHQKKFKLADHEVLVKDLVVAATCAISSSVPCGIFGIAIR